MHGLRYLDGPLYALTSALQRLTAARETHWMRHGGRIWCLTYRDIDSAPHRPAQYTTTFSMAALKDGMD